jgi:hypothetical protein
MSDASGRKWVREALLSLPDKQRNRNLIGALSRYGEMADKASDSLSLAFQTAKLVKTVFGDSKCPMLLDRANKAAANARSCQKELAKSIDVVTKKPFDDRMIAIKDFAAAVGKPVAEVWEKKVSDEIRAYEQVGRIAADRALPGGIELNSKLKELRDRSSRPPQDESDARVFAQKLGDLPKDVTLLGLTGKAGAFLVAAAEGHGGPRDLDDAEVRELLDRYGLWGALRVTLGPNQ